MSRFLGLVRVELSRLRARRALLVILAAAVVVPLVVAVAIVIDTSPPSATEIAQAEREAASFSDDRFIRRDVDRCLDRPGRYGVDPGVRDEADALRAACEDIVIPSAEDFLYTQPLDLDMERELGSGLAVVTLLGALLFVAGTTFVGHDWSTGSMSNQLLFEPRRLRVWTAKALALAVAAGAVGLVVLTTYWLGLYVVVRGRDQAVPEGTLLDCLQHGWRGAGVVAASAVGGYALTMLSRSTVFSLGLLFGVSVAGGLLLATVGPRDPGPVDPTINAQAVIGDGTTYYVEPPEACFRDDSLAATDLDCSFERSRSLGEGLGYFGVLLGVVGVASLGSYRRRDVP
ncbi:hypothetical protein [Nocardioides sp.]|uniref:hypothetical protein n=1 Tax=Nocardioides sp. TaxID=35761 RepID=UPI00238D59D4|nr:hypothetical protein [Nocardioides sp.]MDE0776685.1 hypothetical protein [Nocardioides sp.]